MAASAVCVGSQRATTQFMFYTFILGFFLPLMVICLCFRVHHHQGEVLRHPCGLLRGSAQREEGNRMVSIVVAVLSSTAAFLHLQRHLDSQAPSTPPHPGSTLLRGGNC
ncbi:somatostatin receptor type 2-like protein [Lates japonicus]|uniref:Somatostatin receptor type 2-like protein n=1 Tax=Lates japonicus TaxID=270547 RepID=A0AAD3QZH6_LATJO|nr:somatostatin receptor type 2-like protein [Lates japonicus]